jgi:hypothetical protein
MLASPDFNLILRQAIAKLEKWLEDHHYKGYDPADASLS